MKLVHLLIALAAASSFAPSLVPQTSTRSHSSYSTHSSRKYDFCLVTKDGHISSWGNFNSSDFDGLRKTLKDDTLFVVKDGVRYAITDRSTVTQAKAAIEPMEKLGRQQGELGRQQGQLGAEQGRLGAKQGDYGRQIGQLARKMSQDARDRGSNSEISKQMEAVSRDMKKLGGEQKALGEKQRSLGAKQADLGRQQSQAAREAETKITQLIDEAFAKGLAHED